MLHKCDLVLFVGMMAFIILSKEDLQLVLPLFISMIKLLLAWRMIYYRSIFARCQIYLSLPMDPFVAFRASMA